MIAGNTATVFAGGGIWLVVPGSYTISNTTIAGNTAQISGGAISVNGSVTAGALTLSNVTVVGNQPEGITNPTTFPFNLRNTILAGNIGGNCSGPTASLGNNLSSDATCTGLPSDLPNMSPGFATGTLANNGGPSQTIALAANSPAVDAGSNAAPSCAPGLTDQRGPGFPRVTDGDGNGVATCDIGAFELQPSADVSVTKTTPTTSVNAGSQVNSRSQFITMDQPRRAASSRRTFCQRA